MNKDKKEDHLSHGEIFIRLLKLSWSYKSGCIKAIVLQVILLGVTLAGLSLTGTGIDFLKKRLMPDSPSPVWPFGIAPPADWSVLKVLCVIGAAVIILALIKTVFSYTYSVILVIFLQQGIVVDLRARVYEKMQNLSFRFFDSRSTGTLINRVTGDVQSVRLFIDGVILQLLILVISLVVYVIYMLLINVKLTLLCMTTIPLMLLISALISRRLKASYLESRELMDSMILSLCERVQGIHVVKGFAREKEELAHLERDNSRIRDQKFGIFKTLSIFSPSIEFTNQLSMAILLGYGGFLVVKNELPLGAGLIVFMGLLQRFSGQIGAITGIIDNVQQSFTAAERVFEVLDMPQEIRSEPGAVKIGKSTGKISFNNVSFSYNGVDKVLENIDFSVKPGSFVGIMGGTGSGKSTLLSLIPRFYDVSGGVICLDGLDIRKYDLPDLRRQVGIVFQESFLFSNTIAANISFGYPGATREQIVNAAKLAAADEFIREMQNGYDTVIGEVGIDLSGGQKQRLALARSLLLEPPILLLDDPMAAVDSQTEKEILEGLDSAIVGRTTFLVSHRINVLSRADMIFVLHGGRIVQRGTHDELMSQSGHYSKSAVIQTEIEMPKVKP